MVVTPFFSVVIPVYNRAHVLSRTLNSVLAQSCGDFEIVVVDDGSNDDPKSVVETIADPRIRFLRQDNRGGGAARNAGIDTARGRFVAFLDSDDEFLPDHLAAMKRLLEGTSNTAGYARIGGMSGPENAYALAREMGEWMTANVTVVRYNEKLKATDDKLRELKDRWGRIGISDRGAWANHEVSFVKQLWNMIELARVITLGALRRNESRGAHYKPEFEQRDDLNWLKTTKARWTSDGPELSYEPVDVSLIPPRPRKYDVVSQATQSAGR